MSYDITCPGYTRDFTCSFKQEHTGNSTISYGSEEYTRYCKKDYERGGYGDCPHYKWYMSQYIVTAVLKKLFQNKKIPEFEISRTFRTRIENEQTCRSLLDKYDIVGPILARIVEKDDALAKKIYTDTIVPVTTLIYRGEDKKALIMYMEMVRNLLTKMKEPLQNSINVTNPYLVMNHQVSPETQNLKPAPIKKLKPQR